MPSVRNMAYGLLAAAAVASASDVTQLKKDTFEEFVKGNDIVLAECMLPCQVPVALIPQLTRLVQSLPHGAATARPSPQNTRRPPRP